MGWIILHPIQYTEDFDMNAKCKKWLTALLCIAMSFGVFFYLGMIVTPKDINDSGGSLYYNGMGFLAEPKNSLDIMVYGNSDVYSGFSPEVLKNTYGYSAYASGRMLQNMKNINDLLEKTLQCQTPKLIILETDCFFEERSQYVSDFNLFAPTFIYHSRWKEIKLRDFTQRPSRKSNVDVNKGFISSDLVYKTDFPEDYMGDPEVQPAVISQHNAKEIDDFIQTCRRNQIEVLLVELPSPHSWDYAKHYAVQSVAEKYDLRFVDLNLQRDTYGLVLQTDFRDNGNHLNNSGAQKATNFIGAYICDHFGYLFEE